MKVTEDNLLQFSDLWEALVALVTKAIEIEPVKQRFEKPISVIAKTGNNSYYNPTSTRDLVLYVIDKETKQPLNTVPSILQFWMQPFQEVK